MTTELKPIPDNIPQYQEAVAKYQEPAKQSRINRVKGGSDFEYDSWQATIEYGRQDNFENIWDFFFNVPSLQTVLPDDPQTQQWNWREIEPQTLSTKFYFRPEILRLLQKKAIIDTLVKEGWLLHEEIGRIDTETTTSDANYLLATNNHYLYIQLYMEIIH